MARLELTEEQMTETLLQGQRAQQAGAPLSDNPYSSPYDLRRTFWAKGYLMSEEHSWDGQPLDPETRSPLTVKTKQLEGRRK